MTDERSINEITHGHFLAATGNPEKVWNWSSPAGQVRAKRRGQLLTEAAKLQPGKVVMEVGCGTGLFTEMMASSGATILALDLSPELLQLAHERQLPPEQVEFREMRFEDSTNDGPFDAIVGSSVLHHLDMPVAMQQMYTLLKPGGYLAFAEPNLLNPQIWMERNIPYLREKLGVSPDESAIVRWQCARQLQEAGFEDIHIRNTDWLHPATPEGWIPVVQPIGLWLEGVPLIKEFTGSVLISARRPARA